MTIQQHADAKFISDKNVWTNLSIIIIIATILNSHYPVKKKVVLQSCFTIAEQQVILLRVNKYTMKSTPTRTLTISRPQKRNLL